MGPADRGTVRRAPGTERGGRGLRLRDHELLLAVILDVLDAFERLVPEAIEAAGDDPVERLVAAFRCFCEVIDAKPHAVVLSYRESKSLTPEGRERIKQLEVSTSEPLRACIRDGVEAGLLRDVDPGLVSYHLLLAAHGWALKHWYYERALAFDDYVRKQTALALHSVLDAKARRKYARFLKE